MLKQTSVLALLCAALVGLNPVLSLFGCYPKDYDTTTPAIDAPSQPQIDVAAAAAAATAAAAAAAAGHPEVSPLLDIAARLAVLIAAWFVSKTYPKKETTTPSKG